MGEIHGSSFKNLQVPEWVDANPSLSAFNQIYGSGAAIPTTTIVLPLKSDKVRPDKEQISSLHPEILLFLSKIKRLSVREVNENLKLIFVTAVQISKEVIFTTRKIFDGKPFMLKSLFVPGSLNGDFDVCLGDQVPHMVNFQQNGKDVGGDGYLSNLRRVSIDDLGSDSLVWVLNGGEEIMTMMMLKKTTLQETPAGDRHLRLPTIIFNKMNRPVIPLVNQFMLQPCGRLPLSWYPQSYVNKVNMTNMNMRPDPTTGYPGRTYRFYKGDTVYTFGDGMSYTTFNHKLIKAPKTIGVALEDDHECKLSECKSIEPVEKICQNLAFDIHVRVKNTGKISGSHTVFLYSSPPAVHNSPKKHLLGFEKLYLSQKAKGLVRFSVDVCKHLSLVDENGMRKVALGEHVLHVGDLKHSIIVKV